ncbi:hypothetical protein IWX90DRAFT_413536 [Phyllosticta citrichinensis]|uniref:Uncharacterized protein n=1 Tax=Phyllosticta citrichinensis TaxID=1130410 RepID=A0ABR1Y120_9PEZI
MAALRGLRRRLSSMLISSRNTSTGTLMASTEPSCCDSPVSPTSGATSDSTTSLDSDHFCLHSVDAPLDVDIDTGLLHMINEEVSFHPSLSQLPNIEQLAFAKCLLGQQTPGDWPRALSVGLSLHSKCKCNSPSSGSIETQSTHSEDDADDDECGLGIFGVSSVRSASISSESSAYTYDEGYNFSTVSLPQLQDTAAFSSSSSLYSHSGSEPDSPSSSYTAFSSTLNRRASAPSLFSSSSKSSSDAWSAYTWSTCSAPRPATASSYARLVLVPSFTSAARSSSSSSSRVPSSSPFFQAAAYKSVYSPDACDALSLCRHPSAAAWSVAQLSFCDVKVGMLGRWVRGRVQRQVGGRVRRGWRRVRMGAGAGR